MRFRSQALLDDISISHDLHGVRDILEFSPEIERLQDEIADAYGFTIESHRHQIFGNCQKCNRENSSGRAKKKVSG